MTKNYHPVVDRVRKVLLRRENGLSSYDRTTYDQIWVQHDGRYEPEGEKDLVRQRYSGPTEQETQYLYPVQTIKALCFYTNYWD